MDIETEVLYHNQTFDVSKIQLLIYTPLNMLHTENSYLMEVPSIEYLKNKEKFNLGKLTEQ